VATSADPSSSPVTTLVVPCWNEADRLNAAAFSSFLAAQPDVRLVFVNDGRRDDTLSILRGIESAAPGQVRVLDLERNSGKAEAVRRGLIEALTTNADFIGYWDSDLATPLDACLTFIALLREHPSLDMVIGSRVLLLGRTIERRAVRHYAGRVFATAASVVLDLPVYDTQCGAKLFRASPRLARVVDRPFLSSWVFDVEIIARYGSLSSAYASATLRDRIYEFPLHEWRDVAGSKVRWVDFVRALFDLARIHRTYIGSRPAGGAR
jgi:dolichyl-phosphate beta-glucosyltransferase